MPLVGIDGAEGRDRGPITIVLADDHRVVRAGLRMLLGAEPDFEVIGEAGDLETTVRSVADLQPRVLVLDVNLPDGSSLPRIPELRTRAPATQVVVLTMSNDSSLARAALDGGALGFVLKASAETELIQAVRLAADGRTYLTPILDPGVNPGGAPDRLSPRELEVLRLIALGHTNAEVAAQLYLSVRTVESHRARIQHKTRRASRAALVAYAREHELL